MKAETPANGLTASRVTSLIPYSFAQLDQRSGYPAGIMDPVWHQTMLTASNPDAANELVADLAVELCRHLRSAGHVAGTPDATEVVRLARDLGRLRRTHKAPGRGEFLEAIETALVQGDLLGRGRAVAAAAQSVPRRQRVAADCRRGRRAAACRCRSTTPCCAGSCPAQTRPTTNRASCDSIPSALDWTAAAPCSFAGST